MGDGRRPGRRAAVAILSLLLVGGCAGCGPAAASAGGAAPARPAPSGPSAVPASPASPAAPVSSMRSTEALGDSVPAGSACGCVPYPQLSASSLTVPGTREVTAANDAVGGYTTGDVLTQVRSDPDVMSRVAQADVVEIEVGANDVGYTEECGTSAACYSPGVATVGQNLAAIVARVRELAGGHRVAVVLLDYWSVWLGGRYARAQGPAYVDAVATVTDQVNSVIKQTAARTGAAYVDLRAAFKGPDYVEDETPYLAGDGDHPNAAGHRQIAAALVDVIIQALRR